MQCTLVLSQQFAFMKNSEHRDTCEPSIVNIADAVIVAKIVLVFEKSVVMVNIVVGCFSSE